MIKEDTLQDLNMNQKVSISKKEERRYKREAKVESKRALVAELLISQNGRSDKERDSYSIKIDCA